MLHTSPHKIPDPCTSRPRALLERSSTGERSFWRRSSRVVVRAGHRWTPSSASRARRRLARPRAAPTARQRHEPVAVAARQRVSKVRDEGAGRSPAAAAARRRSRQQCRGTSARRRRHHSAFELRRAPCGCALPLHVPSHQRASPRLPASWSLVIMAIIIEKMRAPSSTPLRWTRFGRGRSVRDGSEYLRCSASSRNRHHPTATSHPTRHPPQDGVQWRSRSRSRHRCSNSRGALLLHRHPASTDGLRQTPTRGRPAIYDADSAALRARRLVAPRVDEALLPSGCTSRRRRPALRATLPQPSPLLRRDFGDARAVRAAASTAPLPAEPATAPSTGPRRRARRARRRSRGAAKALNALVTSASDATRHWGTCARDACVAHVARSRKVHALCVGAGAAAPPRLVVAAAGRRVEVLDLRMPRRSAAAALRVQAARRSARCVAQMASGDGFVLGAVDGRVAIEYFDPSAASQSREFAFKAPTTSGAGGNCPRSPTR